MNKTIKILLSILFMTPLLMGWTKVFAESTQEGDISIQVSPQSPSPFSSVTVSLSSFATNLNNALISWKSDSKSLLSGVGKTKYTFTTGGPNTSTSFLVSITPEGESVVINKSFSITPSDLDILWEASDSYTPPFYKGKALPGRQSQIKVVAYPNTSGLSQTSQKNITYTWKNNFDVVGSASGNGKNKYTFTNSDIKNIEKISVSASRPGGGYTSENNVDIKIVNPQIIFYKKSPLEGILYQKSIAADDYLEDDEITFVAEPYYLSFKDGSSNFIYDWKINGNSVSTPSTPREMTVRPSSRGGYATVGFSIENTLKLFQNVASSLRIEL